MAVEDVMMPDPFTCSPQASLADVAAEMAEHKYGCAVIQQENHKVVGIFTAVDGLRTLAELAKANYKE
jgi:acetoin utilization protein AcuB